MNLNWLVDILIQALNFFYSITGNYGWSIILLTTIINIALYPLTLSSVVQMAAVQRVQPKIAEIQKKYKDDAKKMQEELMKIYKVEKVNPFGGCLPMLLKIPFFIGFFFALQSKEFAVIISNPSVNSSFLWISNLAKPDPYYILIILIALTTYWSQKTMPGSQNSQTQTMMLFMPLFIAVISVSFPAGVQLYWVVSNLLAVGQQLYISKVAMKDKNVSRETF
jgi:YidC/Oxa1 family membrane protein insertase